MSSAAIVRLLSLLVVVSVTSFSLYRETHKDVEKITFTCIPYHATGLLSLQALEYIAEPCFTVRLQGTIARTYLYLPTYDKES